MSCHASLKTRGSGEESVRENERRDWSDTGQRSLISAMTPLLITMSSLQKFEINAGAEYAFPREKAPGLLWGKDENGTICQRALQAREDRSRRERG
jgi:hypothetical protein